MNNNLVSMLSKNFGSDKDGAYIQALTGSSKFA